MMNRRAISICVLSLSACSANSPSPPPYSVSNGGGTLTGPEAPGTSQSASPAGSTPLFVGPVGNPDGGTTECKPGHYVGTYSCEVHNVQWAGDAGPAIPIDGPVDLVLNAARDGEFLTVSGGSLKSAAAGFFQLSADIGGQLDCRTGMFSGQLQNGQVSIPPLPPGGTFTGTMNGSAAAKAQGLVGTWHLTGTSTLQDWWCTGPWNATYQGP